MKNEISSSRKLTNAMNKMTVAFSLTSLLCSGAFASNNSTASSQSSSMADSLPSDLKQACDRYEKLSAIKGHFEGGKWNDAVDKWGGAKHLALKTMLESFKHYEAGTSEQIGVYISQCTRQFKSMQQSDRSFGQIIRSVEWMSGAENIKNAQSPSLQINMFHWRGQRDFMVVAVDGNKVVATGWSLAGE